MARSAGLSSKVPTATIGTTHPLPGYTPGQEMVSAGAEAIVDGGPEAVRLAAKHLGLLPWVEAARVVDA